MESLEFDKKVSHMMFAIKEAIYDALSEEEKCSKSAEAGYVLMSLLMLYFEIASKPVGKGNKNCILGLQKLIDSLEELYKKE